MRPKGGEEIPGYGQACLSSSSGKSLATVLNLCSQVSAACIGELVGRLLSIVCLTIAYIYWGSYN